MRVGVLSTDQHILNMRARLPFRYGIATLTALPHLFVRVELAVDGGRETGIAADGLPPKWFTKDPATSFAADVADMLRVIEHACTLAREAGEADSVFDLWQRIYQQQAVWGEAQGYPPLLWGFGVSLVERAIIDAFCRHTATPFAAALRANRFGLRLGELHPSLAGWAPADLLPATPSRTLTVRHTVGLGDPLTEAEISPAQRVDDGLPESLEASIRTYGLTHFKIKLSGKSQQDLPRLRRLTDVLAATTPSYALTLDGNEQFHTVADFRQFWETIVRDDGLAGLLEQLIFVEQPLYRDVALAPETGRDLRAWRDRPPMIIDESDATLSSVTEALAGGYVGTSYKNCKGVFKGIAAACLLAERRRQDPSGTYLLSGEDLANVGPVALLQDLAAMASLPIGHVERNGHHYFRGLSMFPSDVQTRLIEVHPDLYQQHARNFATLRITEGAIHIGSVVDAPFGLGVMMDPGRFTPVEQWQVASLDI